MTRVFVNLVNGVTILGDEDTVDRYGKGPYERVRSPLFCLGELSRHVLGIEPKRVEGPK